MRTWGWAVRGVVLAALLLVPGAGAMLSGQDAGAPPSTGAGQRGQPPPATGTAFLAGRVIDGTPGRGVAGAVVYLIDNRGGPSRRIIADSQGRFFFSELPRGVFRAEAVKPGYISGGAPPSIDLTDGERHLDATVRLSKLASLEGTVRDETGDPVVGIDVYAFRRAMLNGRRTLRPAGQNRTDDRGAYRIGNLAPGEFVVCACGRDPIPLDGVLLTALAADPAQLIGVTIRALKVGADAASLDATMRTFAPTFHPASATVARAGRVPLASGEDRSGIDVNVSATTATRVSGTILGASGPVHASSLRLTPAGDADEGVELAAIVPALVQPDGRFDFAGVPPGQYVLRVTHLPRATGGGGPSGAALAFIGARAGQIPAPTGPPLPDEPVLWAVEPIVVGVDGLSGLTITLRPAASVTGRVQFTGSTAPPPAQTIARAGVTLASLDPQRPSAATGAMAADGTFRIQGVMPGRYVVRPSGAILQGWSNLKSVTVGGIDVTDLPIEIGAGGLTDVALTFVDTPLSTISGAVAPGRAPPAADDLVMAFPTDRRYWTDPDAASRRLRSSAIGRSGAYSIAGLPAGEYFVVFVSGAAAREWQEAVVPFETLSRGAPRVLLTDGERRQLDVKR
jgi:hypothetical protein